MSTDLDTPVYYTATLTREDGRPVDFGERKAVVDYLKGFVGVREIGTWARTEAQRLHDDSDKRPNIRETQAVGFTWSPAVRSNVFTEFYRLREQMEGISVVVSAGHPVSNLWPGTSPGDFHPGDPHDFVPALR